MQIGRRRRTGRRSTRNSPPAPVSSPVARDAPDPVALARVIGRFVGEPVEVDGLRRCSGGASRETWALDATDAPAGVVHELILRRDPAGQASAEQPGDRVRA